MMLCVYAVVPGRPTRVLPVRGLAREPLRRVTVGRIAAIVGSVRTRRALTPANVRRYDAIIRELDAMHAAIVPTRFGTHVANEEELALILHARAATLRAALRLVRGRAQMTVRLLGLPAGPERTGRAGSEVMPAMAPQPAAAVRHRQSGAEYLRVRAGRLRVPEFEPVRDAVRRWVRADRVERHDSIATVYHLIPRRSVAPYTRALRAAIVRARLRATVTGPWAPYAFSTL